MGQKHCQMWLPSCCMDSWFEIRGFLQPLFCRVLQATVIHLAEMNSTFPPLSFSLWKQVSGWWAYKHWDNNAIHIDLTQGSSLPCSFSKVVLPKLVYSLIWRNMAKIEDILHQAVRVSFSFVVLYHCLLLFQNNYWLMRGVFVSRLGPAKQPKCMITFSH